MFFFEYSGKRFNESYKSFGTATRNAQNIAPKKLTNVAITDQSSLSSDVPDGGGAGV